MPCLSDFSPRKETHYNMIISNIIFEYLHCVMKLICFRVILTIEQRKSGSKIYICCGRKYRNFCPVCIESN
jgi:hypothetical protein